MTEQQKHFPEFYVTAPQSCPYLPGRHERKLFTHLTHDKPRALVDTLLKGGFRRSQNQTSVGTIGPTVLTTRYSFSAMIV